MKEECGVFGKYQFENNNNINGEIIDGLRELQHRGQDSAGIAFCSSITPSNISTFKNLGLVNQVFKDYNQPGNFNISIGHTRYSTYGSSFKYDSIQPITSKNNFCEFSIAHNGNIPNLKTSKFDKLYSYVSDSDFIKEYLKNMKTASFEDLLIKFLNEIPGVYSLLIMTNDCLYAVRDSCGVRPLSIGKNNSGYYISSETVAFGENIKIIREVLPGEIIKITKNINTIYKHQSSNLSHCIFEYIYFSKPLSIFNNYKIEEIRRKLGKELGEKETYKFDKNKTIVVGSPNSGILCGIGYAEATNLKYEQILIKNNNYNRSFIMPDQESRINEACNKFIINKNVKGKDIIILDDSIVRGNTIKVTIDKFKKAEANDIHVRIGSPPVKHPCFFGINIPTYEELIANRLSEHQMAKELGATSLKYLSIEQLKNIFPKSNNFCSACFDGSYNQTILDW